MSPPLARVPVSTYRLQLHAGFTFADALALVPYLAELGVTDCYVSPLLAATPGSTHGYDIVDHRRINPEIGSTADFVAFSDALRAHGMGLVVDIVPNHMGVDAAANPWWRDVLEDGPSSPYARYFDIDWDPLLPELRGKVLLPILGDQYGVVLERGELRLSFGRGALSLRYFDHDLPVNPRQARLVYEQDLDALTAALGEQDADLREFLSILTALRNLPVYTETDAARIAERQREKAIARERLARLADRAEPIRRHVETNVALYNGDAGRPESFDRLHDLLERQPYRLAFWRTATHEINYRRFFDVNSLAGLSVELPEVFDATHALLLELIGQGRITGVRIDHVDGLFAPAAYLERLHAAIDGAAGTAGDFYVVVEKIRSSQERLPDDWRVCGTTGYDFLNDVNGLFIDDTRAQRLKSFYARFTGRTDLPADVLYESKKVVMTTSLASELNVLGWELHRISEASRRSRDFTPDSLVDALREIVATFPVYRTYVTEHGWSEFDGWVIDTAVTRARRRNPAMEPSIFDFVRTALLPPRELPGSRAPFERRLRLAMKFQQFTGPVQAKGLEDTTFYRHVPLASLNEVEGDLFRFGRSRAEFHEANAARRRDWPASMIATATHDTKRGEDARARLNVISEMPDDWRDAVNRWARLNATHRTTIDGQPAPDRGDEYLYYQALVAAWPADSPAEASAELVARLQGYMIKAIREAKVHTSWINPFLTYEDAVLRFVERTLRGTGAALFLPHFLPFQRRLAVRAVGNSLAQVVLKMLSPGVPDIYRGTELWDVTLVDPDNRRPVDFAHRRRLLDQIAPLAEAALGDADDPGLAARIGDLLRRWPDGAVKLFVTTVGLRLRRELPALFLEGDYRPLDLAGAREHFALACARTHGPRWAIAVVPRLATAAAVRQGVPAGSRRWQDTRVLLPDEAPGEFRNVLTGERVVARDGALELDRLLRTCPVALLRSRTPAPTP